MNWEINDGVFFMNLKHPASKQIVQLWKQFYEYYTMSELESEQTNAFEFSQEGCNTRANDQTILQGILYAKYSSVVKAYRDSEFDMFNYVTSPHIKQLLRQYFKDIESRLTVLRNMVSLVRQKKPIIIATK